MAVFFSNLQINMALQIRHHSSAAAGGVFNEIAQSLHYYLRRECHVELKPGTKLVDAQNGNSALQHSGC